MEEKSATDLMRELREMNRFLDNMQKDAKRLLGEAEEPDHAEKHKISEEKRRLSSASSWARSTTKKEYPLNKRKNAESGNAIIDVSKAERYVKTRTPEYTFGVRTPRTEDRRDEGHYNGDYDIKVDSLSTMKRPKTSVISKTARMDPFGITRVQPPKLERPPATTDTANDHQNEPETESATMDDENQPVSQNEPKDQFEMDLGPDDASEAPTEHEKPKHEKSGRAFSFGKDRRFVEPKPEPLYMAVADAAAEEGVVVRPVAVPDVEKAVKALLPHTTTAVMRPATPLTHRPATNTTNAITNTTSTPDIHIDALSYRPRTPTITMRPNTTERKAPVHIDLGTPGPGHYNSYTATTTYTNTTRHTKAAKPVGTLYHTPTTKKTVTNTSTDKPAPGPGTYVLDQSIAATKYNAPAYTLYSTAESKQTPQMQKKLYFEQKARDLREVHDNMSETNLTQVTTRTPTTTLAPPKYSADPKRDNILTEHRLRNMGGGRSTSVSRIDSILRDFGANSDYEGAFVSPNKKFSAVESRVKTGAFMTSEVTARRRTSARIQSRPRVAQRVAEDKLPPSGTQRFYGPQIPVPWTKDTLHTHNSTSGTTGAGNRYNEDIVNEVMSIVERNTNPASTSALYNTEINDTEYTAAYLKSRYSGSLQPKKPAIVMQPAKVDDRNIHNKLTIEQQERDYLGPQLQQEWVTTTSNTTNTKNNTLRMDLVPGREIIKQHAKGISEVIRFNNTIIPTEEMGPGYYNTATSTISNSNTNNVLFDKQISRNDIVGAYGERPISAVDDINTLNNAGEHDIYPDEHIILDYGSSKDKYLESQKHKNLQLYVKDRHPAPLPATDDHLGGTYFQGMAQTALQKPGINFAKHTGRADDTQEKIILNEILPLDGSLDLNIKDYNPNKGNIIQNVVMTDPKKNPRFVQEKPPSHINAPTLDPNYDYKYNTDNNVVNMERMKGRRDDDNVYEEGVIEEERVDTAGARALAAERDAALHTATLNIQKRTPNAVNMSAQIGRHDNDPHSVDVLLNNADNAAPMRYYNDPEQNKPIVEDINKIKAREWSKVPGREGGGDYNNDVKALGGEVLQEREELVLEPTAEGTTKHKKVQGGVEWTKNADNPRFPAAPMQRVNADGSVVQTERLLDLGDVDPGKFRAGMAPLGSTSAGPTFHTQGRDRGADGTANNLNPSQRKILDAAGLAPEELILDPAGNPMHKHTTNITFGSKNNIAGVERTHAGKKVLAEISSGGVNGDTMGGGSGDRLIIEPTDDAIRKRVSNSVSMQNKAASQSYKMDNVVRDLNNSVEVLKLSPTNADKQIYAKPVLATSMSNTNITREDKHTTQLHNELRKSNTVLDTDPHDNVSKFRVTGGTSMKSLHTVRNSTNENKAITEYNRSSTQELKIDPTIQATRVSIPNSAIGRESRINTAHESAINAQLDNNEVLDLNPTQHKTRTKGTINNTEPRFNTHTENTVLNELHTTHNTDLNTTAPEILIIQPTDKTIKKNSSTVKFSGATTGRGGSVQKESVSVRNKNTATDTNNSKRVGTNASSTSVSGTNKITNKPTTTTATGASTSGGKTRTSTPSGKRPTTAGTTTNKDTTHNTSTTSTADGPGTPVLRAPELSVKPPTFKKLSQKELNTINEL